MMADYGNPEIVERLKSRGDLVCDIAPTAVAICRSCTFEGAAALVLWIAMY